jgi:hypothetical protein
VDVNLHPYVLPVACNSTLLVGEIEAALRLTTQSGRSGVGIVNVAAGGNFFSQTEYPGSSTYTVAVGAHSAEDNRLEQANWGGLGVDIVMPSYRINLNGSGDETYGTGIITADLRGPEGYGGSVPIVSGNTNSEWGSLGNILTFPRTTSTIASSYVGTSVSAAYAAGAVALLLSDERFTCMPPLIDYGSVTSRQDRRDRRTPGLADKIAMPKTVTDPSLCPPREEGDNILRVLTSHNELPSVSRSSQPDGNFLEDCGFIIPDPALDLRGRFEYIDGFNEVMGYGRFNPARALAVTPVPTADTLNSTVPGKTEIVSYTFSSEGSATQFDEETGEPLPFDPFHEGDRATIAFGWAANGDRAVIDGRQTVDPETEQILDEERSGVWLLEGPGGRILSPYLEPVNSLVFEDGTIKRGEPGPMYVWTDSLPTAEGVELTVANNNLYNPRGAYRASTQIELVGPKEPVGFGGESAPGLVSIQLGFELGVQTASNNFAVSVREELDRLALNVTYFVDNGERVDEVTKTIYSFTGDTFASSKRRLCAPLDIIEVKEGEIDGDFPIWSGQYDFSADTTEMPIRTFQFMMPPIPAGTTDLQFKLRLSPGSSWLPTYEFDQDGDPVQMFNVFRDHGGFVFYSLKAELLSDAQLAYLTNKDKDIPVSTQQVVLTHSGNDVLYANGVGEFSMGAVEAEGEYLSDARTNLNDRTSYPGTSLMSLTSRITGMKANPVKELVAITTEDGKIYTASTDGTNLKLITTDPGARDPSWSTNGNTLLYAIPTAIKAFNFLSDGSSVAENIVSDSIGPLTDYRTPVFDRDAGVIYFTAVHKTASPAIRRVHVASRSGRVINLSGEDTLAALAGWGNVNMYDIDISESGRRMVFLAHTREAPQINPGTGIVESPAFPSGTEQRMYMIENINWVTAYRNIPTYRKMPSPDGSSIVAARYPRFSVNDKAARPRIVFTQISARPTISNNTDQGPVVIRELSMEDADCAVAPPPPTPAPTVTPVTTATPPPLDVAQVVQMSEISFESTREGWNFGSAAPAYSAPVSGSNTGNRNVTPAIDGALTMVTSGNNNTFGFWSSPAPAFSIIADSLYLVRSRIRASAGVPDSQVPGMRMRANSLTFEHGVQVVTNSRGDLSLSPISTAGRSQDMIIAPPAGQLLATGEFKSYSISFDLANFANDDSSTAGLNLEQVDVYRLDHAPKHLGLWCFEVPASGADVTFAVTGSSTLPAGLYLELRRCCGDATSVIRCATGTSAQGTTLSFTALPAGQYSLVASTTLGESLTLLYTSTAELLATCAPCVTTKEDQFDSILTACQASTAISGLSGESTRASFYDGMGIFPPPTCDPRATNTVVKATELIYSNTMDSEAERSQWGTGGATGFTLPDFPQTDSGLGIQYVNRAGTGFGFWVLDGDDIPLPAVAEGDEGPWIYRATVVLSSENAAANAANVPVVRLRLATGDFQRIAEAVIEPGSNRNLVPVAGRPTQVELFLPLEARPADVSTLVFAYDLIDAFADRPAASAPVVIEDVRIERVSIPSYPTLP